MIAKNIVDGKSIFGINGTAKTGPSAIGELLERSKKYELSYNLRYLDPETERDVKVITIENSIGYYDYHKRKFHGIHPIRLHILETEDSYKYDGDGKVPVLCITLYQIEVPKNVICIQTEGYSAGTDHDSRSGCVYLPNSNISLKVGMNITLSRMTCWFNYSYKSDKILTPVSYYGYEYKIEHLEYCDRLLYDESFPDTFD